MLRPFEELIFRQHRKDGRRDTYENRRYDAFFLMLALYQHVASQTPTTAAQDDTPTDTADDTDTEPAPAPAPAPAPEAQLNPDEPEGAEDQGPPDPPGTGQRPPDEPRFDGPSSGSPPNESPPDRSPTRSPSKKTTSSEPPPSESPPGRAAPSGSPPVWSPPWDPDQVVPLPDKVPGGKNVKVIVNVDHTALLRGYAVAGETVEIAGVGPISVQAAREILRDDPFLAVVVRRGRDVVNVAHHGRGLNEHQRTAIEANGLRCTNIACNRTVALQIDHRVPYADDPITDLDNQDPLCPCCHPLKTHHGHHLEEGVGRRRFLPPGHPDNPRIGGADPTGPTDPCSTDETLEERDRALDERDRALKEEGDRIEARLRARLPRLDEKLRERRRQLDQQRLC